MIKTIHFYGKIVALVLALAILGFLFPAQYTHAETIYGGNTANPITGVTGSSTVALHTSEATLFSGENQTLNRMMITPAYICFATTTDTLIKTGSGILGTTFIGSHSTDVTVNFYDSLTVGTATNTIVSDSALNATNATGKMPGAQFSTGLYMDIIGTGTTTVCYN